jgi:hypothetical protein
MAPADGLGGKGCTRMRPKLHLPVFEHAFKSRFLLQYRLKYRNADLGASSKAPRFCLKHTLHQYRTWPFGALGWQAERYWASRRELEHK